MTLDKDDIRASVASGIITEEQAASILSQADARKGYRDAMDGLDEPFELFRGFNEVFIVIGLGILFAGWMGVVGLTGLFNSGPQGMFSVVTMLISLGVIVGLAQYFTLKRRMIAPSIALVIMFALCAVNLGGAIHDLVFPAEGTAIIRLTSARGIAFQALSAAGLLGLYFLRFRVPFALLVIALSIYVAAFALTISSGADLGSPFEAFRLTAGGPFAIITLVLGLFGLVVALRFDMSDPHRVSRRAQNAFWLHVIAAPAIVNTIALSLLTMQSTAGFILLFLFVLAMAAFAIIIDRRSFLISAFGYMIALSVIVLEDSGFLTMLLLGILLVFLGAKWEAIRGGLMRGLPDFPGKSKLPPYHKVAD